MPSEHDILIENTHAAPGQRQHHHVGAVGPQVERVQGRSRVEVAEEVVAPGEYGRDVVTQAYVARLADPLLERIQVIRGFERQGEPGDPLDQLPRAFPQLRNQPAAWTTRSPVPHRPRSRCRMKTLGSTWKVMFVAS